MTESDITRAYGRKHLPRLWSDNVHVVRPTADTSPFTFVVSPEDGGYAVRRANGVYVSGPHPSKEYATKCATRLNALGA